MNFELSEEHLAVMMRQGEFAQTELLPGVIERDDKQELCRASQKNGRARLYGNDG